MNFKQLEKIIPALLLSGVSGEIQSSPGRGKSEFIRALPARMTEMTGKKWGFTSNFLATATPSDLLGYMVPMKDAQGRVLSQFSVPSWFQTRDPQTDILDGKLCSDYEFGINFLDEYGQGEGDVKRASAELLLNGRLGPHSMPAGWVTIAASNFAGDRSGVSKSFDFVINRRWEIQLTDDVESWKDWALTHGVNPVLVAFAVQNPQVVFTSGVPDKQGPWCTPRSLVLCGKILEKMADERGDLPTHPSAVEIAHGMIGPGAGAQLFAMIKLGQEMPRYEDIVKDPMNCKVPNAPDAQMLVCYSLAARVSKNDVKPVVDYIERLPKEFSVTFAKAATARDPHLVNTQRFGEWCLTNTTLMTAMSQMRA